MKIEIFIPFLTAVSGAMITWLLTRKKSEAEVLKMELANVKDVIALWKGIAEDLRTEVQHLTSEVEKFRVENISLKKELQGFKKVIESKQNI